MYAVGGIIGTTVLDVSKTVLVANCINYGNITVAAGGDNGGDNGGGIAGNMAHCGTVKNCFTSGLVSNVGNSGIVIGWANRNFTCENCYYQILDGNGSMMAVKTDNSFLVVQNPTATGVNSPDNAEMLAAMNEKADENDGWYYWTVEDGRAWLTAEKPAHTHDMGTDDPSDDITFTAWKDATTLPNQAGSFYLDTDVTLNATWAVPVGEVNLCLNGHVIKMNGSDSVIEVSNYATLNLYDCDTTTEHYFKVEESGLWTLLDAETEGCKTTTGGVITGGNANSGGGVHVYGSFTMHGGSISGNTAGGNGGGVFVYGGSFTMHGGSITGNTAQYGGGIQNNGTMELLAAEGKTITITGNKATGAEGGIANWGPLSLSGSVIIKDNICTGEYDDVNYLVNLATNNAITIAGALTGSEIYVTHADGDYDTHNTGVLTSGFTTENSGAKLGDFFTYDGSSEYCMILNQSGELEVVKSYAITNGAPSTAESTNHGYLTIDKTAAAANDTVTITVTASAGYQLKSLKYNDTDIIDDGNGYKFDMPEDNVTVSAEFELIPVANVATIGDTKYETLQSAFDAAIAGDTVKLLADVDVTEQLLVEDGKNFNLDLAGFTIEYTGETTLASGVIGVKHGGALTVKDSSTGKTGAIKSGEKAYAAVAMTIKGDTADTKPAVLTVKGGTLEGYYYGITGNGSTGRGNTKVFVQGGTVKGTNTDDSTGIYNPQSGTLIISGGTVEGATGVYVKAGNPVTVSGGKIIGNGAKGEYQTKGDGFDSTGDGFVVDNCGYPGGAPVPTITGGTFESTNGAPIASYAKVGNTAIDKFVKDGKFNKQLGDGLAAEGLEPTTEAAEDYYYTVKTAEQQVEPHTHSFGVWMADEGESTHSRICECGEVEIGAHEFGVPTVTWTFPANGTVTATYSTTCSVCGKQIFKYEAGFETKDSNDMVVWTATATIGGKQYTATKEVAKTYTVTVPDGFTGGGSYAYGVTTTVKPQDGKSYNFFLNGAQAAFNATSLTFKVTGNVEVTVEEYVKPVEAKPVLTMAVDGSSTISQDAGKYKVPFKISWAIEKDSGISVVEVGYIYRYGGKDFEEINTDTVLAKGSVKTSSLKSLNGSYKCTHSFGTSYAGRCVYAVGYMTYKLNGETYTIYTDEIGTNTANCYARLNK